MQLTQPQIEKFQELYFKQTGKKIGSKDASVLGIRLVAMIKAIYPAENMKMKRTINEQTASE